jgi:hypothetical protein
MTEKMIRDAYCKIGTIDQTIPDDVLDFMKDAAIEKLNAVNFISSNPVLADSCRFYEQDNTTAMNCKHCGKGKWMHGNGNLR